MKFTVEIEDFWLDEDSGSIEKELKDFIKRDVVRHISESLKDQIETTIRQEVEKQFKESLSTEVALITREVIEHGEVKKSSRTDLRIPLKDWIIEQVESNTGWQNPQEQLAKYAKKHMDEIKKQYDFMYASSVVQKMADLGMLKDDKVAELLTVKK